MDKCFKVERWTGNGRGSLVVWGRGVVGDVRWKGRLGVVLGGVGM